VGGVFGWLLRLFGLGPRPGPARAGPGADRRDGRYAAAPPPRGSEQYRLVRRRVIVYVSQARLPIRQAAVVRQAWLADLSKVYAQIASSPTGLVLDRAGAVGASHEPAFREALSLAQAIDPPPEAERAHAALVGWLTCLHAACLALMDARKLRDRSVLGTFREQLGHARRLAVLLVQERGTLFTAYQITIRPSIKSRRVVPPPEDDAERPRPPPAPRGGGAAGGPRRSPAPARGSSGEAGGAARRAPAGRDGADGSRRSPGSAPPGAGRRSPASRPGPATGAPAPRPPAPPRATAVRRETGRT